MDHVEKQEYKGYTAIVEYDNFPLNPREEYDTLGILWCEHISYDLSDKNALKMLKGWLYKVTGEYYGTNEEICNALVENGATVLPVYMYDHSGISISTGPFSCPWDSGQVGIIVRLPIDTTEKNREKILQDEIAEFDQYLRGEVYSYTVYKDDEIVDSCCGYYSVDEAMEQAIEYIDWELSEEGKDQ